MMRPDMVGPKQLYLNPTQVTFTTAEMGLIDTPMSQAVVSPYAYTATVREDYDTANFMTDDTIAVQAAASRVAFGLFLTPDNDKENLLFQVSGKARFVFSTAALIATGGFFFGRKATNNTVVSSKAAASNQLAQYRYLASNRSQVYNAAGSVMYLADSIESQVFSLKLDAGFVYCFGYMVDNISGAVTFSWNIGSGISLAFRKYNTELPVFRPSR